MRIIQRTVSMVVLVALTLSNFDSAAEAEKANSLPPSKATTSNPPSQTQLLQSAKATWKFFVAATDNLSHLPSDRVDTNSHIQMMTVSSMTSPTDIGMYLMSLAASRDLGILSASAAETRLHIFLHTLKELKKWHGFLYNWYDIATGSVATQPGSDFVSTVDNGWFAAGLIVDRQAFPQDFKPLTNMLEAMDFSHFYDPVIKQLYGGYDPGLRAFTTWHYGNLNTESRIADYIAIGEGKVPDTLWWNNYRTVPSSWNWQLQTPVGKWVTHEGTTVFEGHYTLYGEKYVPSWGGSMFEALMPTMVLEEQKLAPTGLGLNDSRTVNLQMQYALHTKKYPVWGISPCALPDGGYGVYGVPGLGTTKYQETGEITPYATYLALNINPLAALHNLSVLKKDYAIWGPYGYYDSVNVNTSIVTQAYLTLDEGMILVSLDNFLKHQHIQYYFNQDPIGQRPQHLLSGENMLIG